MEPNPSDHTSEVSESEHPSGDKFGDQQPTSHRDQKIVSLGVCLFLAIATWFVFGQTLRHEFINCDDDIYVYENPVVTRGLTLDGINWAFTHSHLLNWHPLTLVSHMLDCQLYGLKAGGHHLTNVLLHTVAAILLFLVLKGMTSALWRSAFVAVVFAIHPLRVESVAWVSERKDVLSGVFFMLTLGAYVRYVRQPKSFFRYLAVLLLFALGLMSKPTLVTLPFVLLLLDYWPLNRWSADESADLIRKPGSWRIPGRLILEKIPLFALCIASCAATLFAQKDAIQSLTTLSFPERMGNALVVYVTYLRQVFYPANLAVFYPQTPHLPFWEVALAFTLLVSLSAGIFCWRARKPYLLVGWLWYLGMLVPMIGIIQVGEQAHADRYTYLPHLGLYLLLTWGAVELSASWRHRGLIFGTVGAVVTASLMAGATRQTAYWRNSESLWSHALSCTSGNYMAHYNLGLAFEKMGRVHEAISHWQMAIVINPTWAGAHNNLANVLVKQGRVAEAIVHFQKAIEINPDFAEAHYNLGYAFFTKGQMDNAIAHWQKAVEIKPNFAEAYDNLGSAFFKTGRLDEAIAQWQKALEINSNNVNVHNNLGGAFFAARRMKEAIAHWQKVLEIDPRSMNTRNNLAWVLATCPVASLRNGVKAIALAEQTNQLAGGANPKLLSTLAAAYAEVGQFSDAVATAQRALQLAAEQDHQALAARLRRELDLYQSGQPCRDDGQTIAPAPKSQ